MDWKSTATDIAKLAATIGVNAALHQVDVPGAESPFGPVINDILVALFAAAFVVLLTNGIFERPRLAVSWTRKTEPEVGPAIRYAPEPVTFEEFFGISCTLEGRSLLARWLVKRTHYDTLILDVRYAPDDALTLRSDTRSHARVGVLANGGIRLKMKELPSGAPSWATFTLALGAGPVGTLKVKVMYAFLRRGQPVGWFDRHVVRCLVGVQEVHAIRSR